MLVHRYPFGRPPLPEGDANAVDFHCEGTGAGPGLDRIALSDCGESTCLPSASLPSPRWNRA